MAIDASGNAHYRFESARSGDGGPSKVRSRRFSPAELQPLRAAVQDPSFCELRSARAGIPDEGKPTLKVRLGDRSCAVTLWDGEWDKRPEAHPVVEAVKHLISRM